MNALLLEDEPVLARTLAIACKKLGIDVEIRTTLAQAREYLSICSTPPDLLILDRQVPDGDGITLLSEVRSQGFRGGIIMLTAMGDLSQRVEGLKQGADDYLPKPFSWEEFAARVEALTRRIRATSAASPAQPSTALEGVLWKRDQNQLRILGQNGWITLTPLEFKFADYLMKHSDRIIPREELLREVWGFTLLPKTRTVDHFMGRLRKLLEKDVENPQYFVTIRGAGYRFNPSA
jgi:DNA-binding response OmpR family regulator